MKTGLRVKEVMKEHLALCYGTQTALAAARKMHEHRVGSVLVVQDGEISAIVTHKDLIRSVMAKDKDPERVSLKSISEGPLVTIDSNADVYDAFTLMNQERVRHLPVKENQKIVGIVTMSDLLRMQPAMMEYMWMKAYDEGLGAHAE